ncbi:hypothetical protein [Rhodobacter ferrooxidans]|uniref:hypothetical protein n=1 Tax=Rhodobacter ferrooxidans TaxID=371731 RepID=UPI000312A529|nr:hypothetical protein [Rhodobacter sp. SW2]
MPVLLLILAISVFGYLWLTRRGSSLTRTCLWRQDRRIGENHHRCSACGATCVTAPGKSPRHCLRPR